MPNWCNNSLTIWATKEALDKLQEKAKAQQGPSDDSEIVEFSFYPFIKHLIDDPKNISANELIGCKWFPAMNYIERTEGELFLSFDTAWSPTDKATRHIYKWLVNEDPTCSLKHFFEESGAGFCGVLSITEHNGEEYFEGDYAEWDSEDLLNPDNEEQLLALVNKFDLNIDEVKERASKDDTVIFAPKEYLQEV